MLADYHMHTNYSNDSQYDMEKAILKAIDMGLDEICFTEHSDYGTMGNYVVDYEDYYQGYLKWKEKYKTQILIKLGGEFGFHMHTISSFQKDFKEYPFDFIILFYNNIDDLKVCKYN